jgi:hypothetical protein
VLIVVAIATLFALALSFPVVLHPTTMLYGTPGDATGTVAIFWWWSYAPRHGLPLLDNTWTGAPIGSGWNYIGFVVFQVVLMAPLSFLAGPVAAYNIGALASYPATAAVTFLLARRMGMGSMAAAFAGLAFAFMPLHTEKAQAHLDQAHMEVFPAFILFALRWRLGGSKWNLVAAGAMVGLTLWTDIYMTLILWVLAAGLIVLSVVTPDERSGHSLGIRIRQHVVALMIVAAVAAVFVPAAVALIARSGGDVNHAVSTEVDALRRSMFEIQAFSARPWEYVLPWHANPFVPDSVKAFEAQHLHGSNFVELSLFLGYTVLVLGTIGLLAARRGRRMPVVLALVTMGVGAFFSFPPSVHIGGLTVHFPADMLGRLLPVFRVYSRFGMIVMLGAALLAGVGLDDLKRRLSLRGGSWRALALVPFVTVGLEFTNIPPSRATAVLPAPPEYTWLESQPQGILVEYPLAAGPLAVQEVQTREYTLYQMAHLHRMFNGATPPSTAGKYAYQLEPYYSPQTVDRLRSLGIRYVFVHRADYIADGLDTPQSVPGLQYVTTLDGTDIFTVTS